MPVMRTMFGNVRVSLWLVILVSSNILTGLFVSLNSVSSPGRPCKVYAGIADYQDINPLYHNFDVEHVQKKRRFESLSNSDNDSGIRDSEWILQRKRLLHQTTSRLKLQLKQLGIMFEQTTKPITVHANCSIASRNDACTVGKLAAVFDISNSSPAWRVTDTNLTIHNICIPIDHIPPSTLTSDENLTLNNDYKSVFAITPTYARYTQKVDLTSLCQTVMHITNLVWIVIEDAEQKTDLVSKLLDRCKVTSVHLNVRTPPSYRPRPGADRYKEKYSRGVKQRNLGLSWIREYCMTVKNCTGAVYFMDDDNKYDLRLFEEIKKTLNVSVFPVGFSGGLKVEGPMCDDGGKATLWHAEWNPERAFPIDMAGFAVQVQLLLLKPDVMVGFDQTGPSKPGYLETNFLENFASRQTVECRGKNEVLVWHVKTQKPFILFEANNPSDDRYEF